MNIHVTFWHVLLTWDRNKNRKSNFTIVFVFIDFVQVDIMHHWHAELENNPLWTKWFLKIWIWFLVINDLLLRFNSKFRPRLRPSGIPSIVTRSVERVLSIVLPSKFHMRQRSGDNHRETHSTLKTAIFRSFFLWNEIVGSKRVIFVWNFTHEIRMNL